MNYDFTVVGAGLTGSTIARQLTDAGFKVQVLERRPYIGGNCADYQHESGIRLNRHGPHYFRTNSKPLWAFVNRFTAFHDFRAVLQTQLGDRYFPWPLTRALLAGYNDDRRYQGTPRNFEEAILAQLPYGAYRDFIYGYTRKQWAAPPARLWPNLASRIDVREATDPPWLKLSVYQGIPVNGYTAMIKRMLEGIEVHHTEGRRSLKGRVVWTGGIDEYFDYDLGALRYRGQKYAHRWVPGVEFVNPTVQTNCPILSIPYIREVEWKHMLPMGRTLKGSLITREYPIEAKTADERAYPYPDGENKRLYRRYEQRAAFEVPDVLFCGRLGEFRYLDMDAAVARALMHADRLIEKAKVAA